MKNIITENNNIKLKLTIISFQESGIFVVVSPGLKLSSRSVDSKEKAVEGLKRIVERFFEFYNSEEKLQNELKRLKWHNNQEPNRFSIPKNTLANPHEVEEIEFEIKR